MISAQVPARTIRNGGSDLIEWGYWGPSVMARGGSKTATKTYRFYHGTTTKAYEEIKSSGKIVKLSPAKVAADIERRYGIEAGMILHDPGYYFSRDREDDPYIYCSGVFDTSASYAHGGSEIIFDALNAAWFKLNPSEDPRGRELDDPIALQRQPWVAEQMRQYHGEPIVLTLDLAAPVLWDLIDERGRQHFKTMDKMVEVLDQYGLEQWTTMMLRSPVPASLIVDTRRVASKMAARAVWPDEPPRIVNIFNPWDGEREEGDLSRPGYRFSLTYVIQHGEEGGYAWATLSHPSMVMIALGSASSLEEAREQIVASV